MINVENKELDKIYNRLNKQAESAGYHLNPDIDFTKDLIKGLIINGKRYGYWACPCRLASGNKKEDLDIICPCDYRDVDLNEFNSCYCALYVSKGVVDSKIKLEPVPERRPTSEEIEKEDKKVTKKIEVELDKPVWRCKVCGYLCGRDEPPEVCPICKASKERFVRFM
jgi:ferredoxin-thioredoxin reductase catalytic subunit